MFGVMTAASPRALEARTHEVDGAGAVALALAHHTLELLEERLVHGVTAW
jgi:hypothetical protein